MMSNRKSSTHHHAKTACHECDLLQVLPVAVTQNVVCCRCGALLHRAPGDQPQTSLALVLTTLFVFALANVFPVVGLEVGGVRTATTLLGTVSQLMRQDMLPVAMLVLFTGVLLPGIELLALLYLLLPLTLGRVPHGFPRVMRAIQMLHPWGMVEVFLLGVLVSLVKLAHLAQVHPGIGLWSFFVLIVLLATSASRFDAALLWERYEACRAIR